ncbi:hypothetical protein C1H46_043457 [Malus baccata]|uniref:Methyltransferase domain-containing protein n=1 Tax=Malus baccata TaxID=106549 RepID=A0A540K9X2_MALBA|nr:hypothetical protein C1H46_043457 [Malus baccata]
MPGSTGMCFTSGIKTRYVCCLLIRLENFSVAIYFCGFRARKMVTLGTAALFCMLKFFKSRHYLDKEWGKYFSVGCGAGNYFTVFPLVAMYADVFVHACDFSTTAVNLVKTHKDLVDTRVSAFVCDLTIDDLSKQVSSSVSREDVYVMKNNRNVLKKFVDSSSPAKGCALFRDYATGDLAQHAFYFSNELLTSLFEENGFDAEELDLCCKQVENRSTELVMNQRWVQAVFRLSDDTNSSTKTEAETEVDHLGQEKIVLEVNEKILKKPVNDLEVDISDGVVMEMSGVLPSNDNEADISGQTDYKKIRVGNRDHIEAIKEANSQGFDIILGTDVTYVAEAILPLFQTAKELISSDRSTAEDSEPALIFVIFSFL